MQLIIFDLPLAVCHVFKQIIAIFTICAAMYLAKGHIIKELTPQRLEHDC